MKTMNITLFTIAFAVAMVIAGSVARAGFPVPDVLQCAETMVYEMRNCSSEQPGRVNTANSKVGRTDATAKAVNKTDAKAADKMASKAKTEEQAQGFFAESCNLIAYLNYLSCTGSGYDRTDPSGGKKTDETPGVKAKASSSAK